MQIGGDNSWFLYPPKNLQGHLCLRLGQSLNDKYVSFKDENALFDKIIVFFAYFNCQ